MKKLLLLILFLLTSARLFAGDTGIIQIKNLSYPKGINALTTIAGKSAVEIKLSVESNNRPVAGMQVLLQAAGVPKGVKGFPVLLMVSDNNGLIVTNLSGFSKKGEYFLSATLPALPYQPAETIRVTANEKSWIIMVIIGLLGGLGMFLFGMKLGADGLQNMAGGKMKDMLSKFTTNPVSGVLAGFVTTAAVQSSSATSSMCVGFVSATLMTLAQSFSVMLGARIGTTITAQLIAFKISDYSLLLVIGGFILLAVAKTKKIRNLGEILIGFGLIFFGMGVMSEAMMPLRSNPAFTGLLLSLGNYPLLALLFAALFTAIIQSSGATVGLAMVFADQGLITLSSAMPISLGAIIGTTMTGILASLGANRDGKRVAVANLLFAVMGVLVCYPFLGLLEKITVGLSNVTGMTGVPRQVANAYTLMSIWGSLVFLPFLKPIEKLMMKLMPPDPDSAATFQPMYLQEGFENSPGVALDLSRKEIGRMWEILIGMINTLPDIYEKRDEKKIQSTYKEDDKIDILDEAIRPYLNTIARSSLSRAESASHMAQLYLTSFLEASGDVVVKEIMHQAKKLVSENLTLPQGELQKIRDISEKVSELYHKGLESFTNRDHELAEQITQLHFKLGRLGKKYQQEHYSSLQKSQDISLEQSAIFLDTIGNLLTLSDKIFSIAEVIIEEL